MEEIYQLIRFYKNNNLTKQNYNYGMNSLFRTHSYEVQHYEDIQAIVKIHWLETSLAEEDDNCFIYKQNISHDISPR